MSDALRSITTTELQALWLSLAADPERQALEVARLCVDKAPHLAAWLEHFIVRKLPDALFQKLLFHHPTDGRIQALNLLYEVKHRPAQKPKTKPAVKKAKPRQRPKTRTSAEIDLFHALFGVMPAIHLPLDTLRLDWEMGRLAIKINSAAEIRLWAISRDLTRRENGSGVVKKDQLWQRLQNYGIPCTKRHFNRLLKAGSGLFWHIQGDVLYLRGYQAVAQYLLHASGEMDSDAPINRPGVRDALVDPSGSLEQLEANLYAAWIAGRGYKHDVTISRAALATLFGRHPNTLRKWEADRLDGIVTKRLNIAQCPEVERYADHIPLHAQPYVTQLRFKGQLIEAERLYWQLPNTYHAAVSSHAHRGQANKVRRAVNAELPAEEKHGGHCLRYLRSPDALKRRCRSVKFRMGEYGDTMKPVYVYLGEQRRSKRGVFEINNSGFVMTYPSERLSPQMERGHFKRHPSLWLETLAYWQTEAKAEGLKTPKLGHFLEGL